MKRWNVYSIGQRHGRMVAKFVDEIEARAKALGRR
jgi:hypothetical protein